MSCAFKIAELVEGHGEVEIESRGVGGIFLVGEAFEEGVARLFVV